MSNFRIGQKVVLVNNFDPLSADRAAAEGVVLPEKGPIYTVREYDQDAGTDEPYIRLVELVNGPHIENGIEPSFEASLFRPVVERGTDAGMSILRNLLNKQSKTAREDA